MTRIITTLIATTIISGCVSNYFQPPKPEYEYWRKNKQSTIQIKKALLECGKPSPSPTIRTYEFAFGYSSAEKRRNHSLTANACMEAAGFKDVTTTVREVCTWDHRDHLPICQPGAEIPKRSVDRRLNSWWCRIHTDYKFCLDRAVNPAACHPDDHKNPPPECLP